MAQVRSLCAMGKTAYRYLSFAVADVSRRPAAADLVGTPQPLRFTRHATETALSSQVGSEDNTIYPQRRDALRFDCRANLEGVFKLCGLKIKDFITNRREMMTISL